MVLSGLLFQRVFASAVLTILFSVAPICLRAAEPDEVAGTMPEDYLPQLKQILAQAMARNPDMIARDFERVMQEARLTMSKSQRLPGIGGNFDYGISESASTNNASKSRNTGAQYNFSLGQALFHWGAIKNDIEIAKLGVKGASRETARVYRDIAAALRKSYLALIVQKLRVQQARQSFELARTDLEIAEAKKADGTISAAAYEGEKLRVRELELVVSRVALDFENNRRNLARVAGIPEADLNEASIPTDIPRPDYDEPLVAAVAAKTLRENARGSIEREIYDLKLEEAVRRQKIVATRLLPKFGVGAGYSLRNNTYVNGPTVNQEAVNEQRIAISGEWRLFDGFATSGAKREAAAGRRALEHRKNAAIDELLQNVQHLERTLKLDAEHLDLTATRHGIAITGHDLVIEGVELGTLPRGDIRRSEVNKLGAHAQSLEARAVFLGRWAELMAVTGNDPLLKNFSDRNARY